MFLTKSSLSRGVIGASNLGAAMVYFVQGEKMRLIKIGQTSRHLKKRFDTLQVGSPDRLVVVGVILNRSSDAPYHVRFSKSWVHGEWFRPTAHLMGFIKTLSHAALDSVAQDVPVRRLSEPGETELAKLSLESRARIYLRRMSTSKPGSAKHTQAWMQYSKLMGT